jgi:hypothetical protein
VFGDIIEIHFPRPVSVQLLPRTAKVLMPEDGQRLWSWPENLEIGFLRKFIDQIVHLINIVHIPQEALARPPQQPSRLAKTAHDGVLVCNHQIWVIPEPKVSTLDIELLDADYLCHLLETPLLHPMAANLSVPLF